MIINDKRKPNTLRFANLNQGECFIDEEGCYCMVVDDPPHKDYNAVDLENGRLYWFECDQEVVKVNARLEVF